MQLAGLRKDGTSSSRTCPALDAPMCSGSATTAWPPAH